MSTDEPSGGKDGLTSRKPSPAPPEEKPPAADGHQSPAPAERPHAAPGMSPIVKWLLIGAGCFVVLVFVLYYGIPWIITAWNTESTDDAYVNGHATFVAPRVSGQVTDVFTDDNHRVRRGDLLVKLDKEPYQIVVNFRRAFLEQSRADLIVAKNGARAQLALARGNRFKLERSMEDVRNQIALLRANVAALRTAEARLNRAKADYDRAKELSKTPGAISQQDIDLKLQDFKVAEAQTAQALQAVYQVRVGLGLPAQPKGEELTEVPSDLDQTFSAVKQALAELLQSAAPLSIHPSSYDQTPKQILDEFYRRDPEGNLDHIYAQILRDAPAVKQAEAKLLQAEADLAQAELNLSYCNVYAEIDGVIVRRSVNPGNNVQVGQSMMGIRSLTEIWIDANFKETQLRRLRIGQRARLEVDMYGSHFTYHGRITGFTMGTGSTLSLLPPQNATGNFVKIVQRLPVRIELDDYDPDRDPPLFLGLSVVPFVYFREPPTGPNAGLVLQPFLTPETKEGKQ
jgi:membrane fusion protein, multidrug efflux system